MSAATPPLKAKNSSLTAVVLAAGRSTRMEGINKLLCRIDGVTMVRRVVDTVLMSHVSRCIVVTGNDADLVTQEMPPDAVTIVHNSDFANGLSSSLRAGVSALPDEVDGVMILLGDMPGIDDRVIHQLIRSFEQSQRKNICIPVFDGQRGNPVIWPRRFFSDLCNLSGDSGGRQMFKHCEADITECVVHSDSVLRDIDTREQLDAVNKTISHNNNHAEQ